MRASLLARVSGGLAILLACEQMACTAKSTAVINAPRESLVAKRGLVHLVDADGDAALVAPESDITFFAKDGSQTSTVQAGLLCRTDQGLSVRDTSRAPCATATPLIDWDDIDSANVETFDGAATTAISAGIVIVIAAAIFVIGSASKKSSSPSSSSGRTSARPTTTAPRAGDSAPPVVAGGGGVGGGTTVVFVPRVGIGFGNYGYGYSSPRPVDDDGALFTRTDVRRSTVRGVLGLDGGACVLSPGSCFTSGFRGGVRLFNLVELTLGFRAIEGWGVHDYPRLTPVLGVGMHGELSMYRKFALELGAQVGHTDAMDVYANLLLGFRIAPIEHFWIGVFPVHPTYLSWSDGRGDLWALQSSLDLSVDF